jgi:hypothetical protein
MRNSQVNARIPVTSVDQVDDDVAAWLQRAYEENS